MNPTNALHVDVLDAPILPGVRLKVEAMFSDSYGGARGVSLMGGLVWPTYPMVEPATLDDLTSVAELGGRRIGLAVQVHLWDSVFNFQVVLQIPWSSWHLMRHNEYLAKHREIFEEINKGGIA